MYIYYISVYDGINNILFGIFRQAPKTVQCTPKSVPQKVQNF